MRVGTAAVKGVRETVPVSASTDDVRRRPGGRSALVSGKVRAATLALLEEVGYDGLQLTDVAARAGVNRTTLYRRWPSKPQLVAELVGELADEQVPNADTGSLTTDLAIMLDQLTGLLRVRAVRAVLRAAVTLVDDDPEVDGLRRSFWDRQLHDASVVVTRAIQRGELAAGTDPRLFLEQVFGPVYFRVLVTGREYDADELQVLAATAGRG